MIYTLSQLGRISKLLETKSIQEVADELKMDYQTTYKLIQRTKRLEAGYQEWLGGKNDL